MSALPVALTLAVASPAPCARPNVEATTIRGAEPEASPEARLHGDHGIVDVVVSLDADGRVSNARVLHSPSVRLNAAALDAARRSIFRPEIRDCRQVARDYIFPVHFSADDVTEWIDDDGPSPMAVVRTFVESSAPVAAARVKLFLATDADSPAPAEAAADAAVSAFRLKLRELVGPDAPIVSDVARPASLRAGRYVAAHAVELRDVRVDHVAAIIDAAPLLGATEGYIALTPQRDERSAAEALNRASSDALVRARRFAAAQHFVLGELIDTQTIPWGSAAVVLDFHGTVPSTPRIPRTIHVRSLMILKYAVHR